MSLLSWIGKPRTEMQKGRRYAQIGNISLPLLFHVRLDLSKFPRDSLEVLDGSLTDARKIVVK